MTVCIAAICLAAEGHPVIIGASDRKLTAGGVEFEPPTAKFYKFTPYIVAMTAGDADAQVEICDYVYQAGPRNVRETVRLYCEQLGAYNLRQAERIVLAPLGFTMKSFLAAQRRLSPEFVETVLYDMRRERVSVETIICGIDGDWPQLYRIESNGRAHLYSSVGFAAIGDGGDHAESQFMFAKYAPNWILSRAMMLTYYAKKRAEVAPGVGEETDMFFIAHAGHSQFYENVLQMLDTSYRERMDAQKQAENESNTALEVRLTKLVTDYESQHGPLQAPSATQSPDAPEPEKKPTSRRKKPTKASDEKPPAEERPEPT